VGKWIFFQNGWDPEYAEAGGPGFQFGNKSNALTTMPQNPS